MKNLIYKLFPVPNVRFSCVNRVWRILLRVHRRLILDLDQKLGRPNKTQLHPNDVLPTQYGWQKNVPASVDFAVQVRISKSWWIPQASFPAKHPPNPLPSISLIFSGALWGKKNILLFVPYIAIIFIVSFTQALRLRLSNPPTKERPMKFVKLKDAGIPRTNEN